MQDADGNTVSPGANDVVRVKIGRSRETPLLDLDTVAASANGSKVTKNTPTAGSNRVEISQLDMGNLEPGVYGLELSLVDNADSQAIKHVDNQVFVVQASQLGDVGMT